MSFFDKIKNVTYVNSLNNSSTHSTLASDKQPRHLFNGHFPGQVGTRVSPFWILLEPKMTEVVVLTTAATGAKLQTNCHRQRPAFYRPDSLPVIRPQH